MIQFSVIIPLYNKANFVKKTIESILAQTYLEFEIVIVNDGSTDDSLAIVNEITDPRIHILSKENGGVSAARNNGIEKAQYDYITFLDADDLWLPDYLETIKGMIEQYPQAGIFATTFSTIDHLGVKRDFTKEKLPIGEILLTNDYCRSMRQCIMNQLCTDTVCVKKELFHTTGGFREEVKRGEDLDMWLRLSLISPIVWKNEPKALYNLVTENNAMINTIPNIKYPLKESFPYWEWYSYSSSFYVKMYANKVIKNLIRDSDYKDKIFILLFKVNWLYVFFQLFYWIVHTKIMKFFKCR